MVILANDNDSADTAARATPAVQPRPAGTRRSAPLASTAAPTRAPAVAIASPPAAGTRFDGGPDEGTRGPAQLQFKERAGGPSVLNEGR